MGKITSNTKDLKITRKKLRDETTEPEILFWSKLRNKQFLGIKFRRQHSVGRYILDFYSAEKKLCIELDGDSHLNQIEYDNIRTDFLNSAGIKVIRYDNKDILSNIDGVLENLKFKIENNYIS